MLLINKEELLHQVATKYDEDDTKKFIDMLDEIKTCDTDTIIDALMVIRKQLDTPDSMLKQYCEMYKDRTHCIEVNCEQCIIEQAIATFKRELNRSFR